MEKALYGKLEELKNPVPAHEKSVTDTVNAPESHAEHKDAAVEGGSWTLTVIVMLVLAGLAGFMVSFTSKPVEPPQQVPQTTDEGSALLKRRMGALKVNINQVNTGHKAREAMSPVQEKIHYFNALSPLKSPTHRRPFGNANQENRDPAKNSL